MRPIRLLPLAVAALLAACTPSSAPPGDAAAAGIPATPPDVRGTITAVEADGRIRVEEDPGETSGTAKAVVSLTGRTAVLAADGARAERRELQAGRVVSVWFEGPVMESYPVQARARTVVLEP